MLLQRNAADNVYGSVNAPPDFKQLCFIHHINLELLFTEIFTEYLNAVVNFVALSTITMTAYSYWSIFA